MLGTLRKLVSRFKCEALADEPDSAIPFTPDAYPPAQEQVREWLESLGITEALGRGGAWRDAHFGRPIKDYDIVATVSHAAYPGLIHKLKQTTADIEPMSENVDKVECKLENGTLVDLMLYRPDPAGRKVSPSRLLDESDFGISAIVADMFSRRVWVSENFNRDSAVRQIQPNRLMCEEVVQSRGEKLHKKYPDFTMVKGPVIRNTPHWI